MQENMPTEEQFNTRVANQKTMPADREAANTARDAIQTAITDNDYAAWKEAMSAVTSDETKLTEDVFAKIVSGYALQERISTAIKNNDFAAWKTAMTELLDKQKEQLTQERFDEIVKNGGKPCGMPGEMSGFGMGKGMHRDMPGSGMGKGTRGMR
jgi:DNA-binding FadR family transcriptional regulator